MTTTEGRLKVTQEKTKRKGICYVIHDARGRRIASDPILVFAKDKARKFLHGQDKTFDGFEVTDG